MSTDTARAVLADYSLDPEAIEPIRGGNINTSYAVTAADAGEYVLQRLSPIFGTEIHEDIEAVTRHLAAAGLTTPRLLRTRGGGLYSEYQGDIWRLLTRVPGVTRETVEDEHTAAEAGALLARFHRALADLDYEFQNRRRGIHDTDRHLRTLRTALERHRGHSRYPDIADLAAGILDLAADLPELPGSGPRKVHGDPKISNILFDESSGAAVCLIDLDTLGHLPLAPELGDALRSWCNPRGEDTRETEFSLAQFRAALQGYAGTARDFVREEEWRGFLPATYRICVELAARFCADALEESYFNWDPQRFASRSEHNEVRAAGQLQTARSLKAQYQQAGRIIEEIFGTITG